MADELGHHMNIMKSMKGGTGKTQVIGFGLVVVITAIVAFLVPQYLWQTCAAGATGSILMLFASGGGIMTMVRFLIMTILSLLLGVTGGFLISLFDMDFTVWTFACAMACLVGGILFHGMDHVERFII